jgi:hypothetical protein
VKRIVKIAVLVSINRKTWDQRTALDVRQILWGEQQHVMVAKLVNMMCPTIVSSVRKDFST